MKDAHLSLKGSRAPGATETLNLLVVAPLPFYCNGVEIFDLGVSVFYAELLPRLARLGHTVRVIAEAPPTQNGQKRTGLSWDVPRLTVEWFAFEFQSGLTPLPPSHRAVAQSKIKPVFNRLVQEQKPDIVIIGRETLTGHVLDLCQAYRLPSLLIAHGVPTAALLQDAGYPENLRQELVERFRQLDCVVTVGKHLEETLRTLGIPHVWTIPNVADPARFYPAPKDQQLLRELHIAPDQIVVGHLSTLKQGKRPFDIISSAEIVLRAHPDIVYLIVGDGPCRNEMEELSRRKGIAANVRYVGEIDHQQVPQYLNLADIVLLPSEREGFPLVYRETQACGRVLLVSDIPAAKEAIVDRETGLLFRLGDIDDLAAKTLALAQDPLLRQQIGRKARIAALAQTPQQWVQAYVEVLQQTVMGCTKAP
jgi:glycosyltransferase involved in cell wall biosynthesis